MLYKDLKGDYFTYMISPFSEFKNIAVCLSFLSLIERTTLLKTYKKLRIKSFPHE